MNEQLTEIIVDALKVIIGIILGVFIGEPIRRFGQRRLDRTDKRRQAIRPRPQFRVTQLCDPNRLFDYSSVLKEQNRNQSLALFDVDDFRRFPERDEVVGLGRLTSKKDFLDRVGALLAQVRRETWEGLRDRSPDKNFKGRRELVITNIPIPGNFYGWNSKDRNLLLISTAPVAQFFSVEDEPTIEDFIVRMVQRMIVFSLVPSLDPMTVHSGMSRGCLFDFTILLQGVVDVVREPYICPTCAERIARDRGDEFYEKLTSWIDRKHSG